MKLLYKFRDECSDKPVKTMSAGVVIGYRPADAVIIATQMKMTHRGTDENNIFLDLFTISQ